jgi:hypothetical protein
MARLAKFSMLFLATALAASLAACQSSRISAKNKAALTTFEITGDPGTPFNALISDTAASWQFNAVVPLTVAIANNQPPVRMVASKLTASNQLLSLEVISGVTIIELASTSDPFGSAAVQTGGILAQIAPPASPDVRFAVKAPVAELFTTLIEDQDNGFIANGVVPALFLFENPHGRIDGLFSQIENFGNFDVDLIINGAVVDTKIGGPDVTVKSP